MHRIWLKQNVFKPHRLHLYQIMVNERKTPHLWVSFGYMLLQGVIIFFIVNNKSFTATGLFAVILKPLILMYIILKVALMKK